MTSTNFYEGSLVEYAGGQSLTGTYQAPGTSTQLGAVSISFTSTTTATLTLPTGRTVTLARYAF